MCVQFKLVKGAAGKNIFAEKWIGVAQLNEETRYDDAHRMVLLIMDVSCRTSERSYDAPMSHIECVYMLTVHSAIDCKMRHAALAVI